MKVAVLGTGYVGLVTGACFAETGNQVICIDTDEKKIEKLCRSEIPFYEPGLKEIVHNNMQEERLTFSTQVASGLKTSDIAFVCVGTPSKQDGSADLQYVFQVADDVAKAPGISILAIKSTVPVGTADEVRKRLETKGGRIVHVVSNPEFLREGSAVQDCLVPDRIILGTEDEGVKSLFRNLYAPYVRTGNPIFVMDVRSAEMTKYAANAFLAQRISFMNELSMLCEGVDADISMVRKGIASDHRIGSQYLFPSVGFGGSCFPKDVRALISIAQSKGHSPRLLTATLDVNDAQKKRFVKRVIDHYSGKGEGKRIALWGLSFKAKTDDIRESPSLTVIDGLLEHKFELSVFDPVASSNVEKLYGKKIRYAANAYDAIENADGLCILTEWNQFRVPDFQKMKERMKTPVIFDGRNLYDPKSVASAGFKYFSIGRKPSS